MPGFTYFLPDRTSEPTPADVRRAGLGHILDGEGATSREAQSGPAGRRGFIVGSAPPDVPTSFKYLPDAQTWTEGPDGAYWIGYSTAERPTPADLVRRRPVRGESVRLLDGNEWIIPVAVSIASGSTLPKRLVLGPDKKSWHTESLPEFMQLCGLADDVYALMESAVDRPHPAATYGEKGEIGYKFDWGMNIALAGLAVNYKLGPMEVSILGLLGDGELSTILQTLIDLRAYKEMVRAEEAKLRASGSANTSAGSGASSVTTSPPSQT